MLLSVTMPLAEKNCVKISEGKDTSGFVAHTLLYSLVVNANEPFTHQEIKMSSINNNPFAYNSLRARMMADGKLDAQDLDRMGKDIRRFDVDGDGVVSANDVFIAAMRGDWRSAIGAYNTIQQADFTGDGVVSVQDQFALLTAINVNDANHDGSWDLANGEYVGHAPRPRTRLSQLMLAQGVTPMATPTLSLMENRPKTLGLKSPSSKTTTTTQPRPRPKPATHTNSTTSISSRETRLRTYWRGKIDAILANFDPSDWDADDRAVELTLDRNFMKYASLDDKEKLLEALLTGWVSDDDANAAARIFDSCSPEERQILMELFGGEAKMRDALDGHEDLLKYVLN